MGMTDEEIAAAKANLNAKVEMPTDSEPAVEASAVPKPLTYVSDFVDRCIWLMVVALVIGALQFAMIPFMEAGNEQHFFTRMIVLMVCIFCAIFLAPDRKVVSEEQAETSFLRRHKWLAFGLTYLVAGLAAAGVQAAMIPFLDVDNSQHFSYKFAALFSTLIAGIWLAPKPAEQDTVVRGFGVNIAHIVVFSAFVIGAGLGTWRTEAYLVQQELDLIAAIEAQYQADQKALRQAQKAQQAAEKAADREAAHVAAQAAVKNSVAAFQLPFSPSQCDWGTLPTNFSDISFRHKIKALYQERTQGLQECLQQEMNKNFDSYSALLIGDVGGSIKWDDPSQPAKAWRDVPPLMKISYPTDMCDEACRTRLRALKTQVGEIAQARADAFGVEWKRYMRVVVNPAIREGDEMDWESGREQREKEAAEQAYLEASRRGLRNADGGFSDMIKGISRAADNMARRIETPSNQYQRQQNEYYQQQGAKKYWDSKSSSITLHSETRPSAPASEEKPGSGCVYQMGFRPKNADKPIWGAGLKKLPICKALPPAKKRQPLCPEGVPENHCAEAGWGQDHCRVTACEGKCSCAIQK